MIMDRTIDLVVQEFNLDREPFSDEGVSGLFYPGARRQQTLEQLAHLTRYGPPLLLLLGAKGAGKSTIVGALIDQMDTSVYAVVHFSAGMLCDELQLIEQIVQGFNIKVEHHPEPFVEAICRFSRECESYSRTPLLVIDDAHLMSQQAVGLIGALIKRAGTQGLKLLLVADGLDLAEVAVLGQLEPYLEEAGQSLSVTALDRQETEEYLQYRLRTAGLGNVAFNRQQIDAIYQQSDGVIDRINVHGRQALVESLPVGKKRPAKNKLPKLHLAAAVIVFALLSFSILLNLVLFGDEDSDSSEVVDQRLEKPITIEQEAQVGEEGLGAGSTEESASNNPPVDAQRKNLLLKDAAKTEASKNFSQDIETEISRLDLIADSKLVREEEVDYNYADERADLTAKADEPVVAESDEVKQHTAETFSEEKPTSNSGEKPASVSERLAKQPNAESGTGAVVDESDLAQSKYTVRERWILALPAEFYTLQLLGVRDEQSARQFIARYPSLSDIAYYKAQYKGKDWFVVIYGQFPTKAAATVAVKKLPQPLQKSQPWTRQFSAVHQELRR